MPVKETSNKPNAIEMNFRSGTSNSRVQIGLFETALAISFSLIFATAAFCQEPKPAPLTAAHLHALLKDGDSSIKSVCTRVIGAGPGVTVLAKKQASSSDRDLKIDAIFWAKKLIDAAPTQIEKVEIIFSQDDGEGKFVSITRKEIEDYGSGKMSADAFLNSLALTETKPDDLPTIEPGPFKQRRLLALERIDKLRREGTGVQPFEKLFQDVEAATRTGDQKIIERKLANLEDKLTGQEEQVALAKKTASGRGINVPARETKSETRSFGGENGMVPDMVQVYRKFPLAAEIIRDKLKNDAPRFIQLTREKNQQAADKLAEFHRLGDEAYQSGRKEEAFACMNKFGQLLFKTMGINPFEKAQSIIGGPRQQAVEPSNRPGFGGQNGPNRTGQISNLRASDTFKKGQGQFNRSFKQNRQTQKAQWGRPELNQR